MRNLKRAFGSPDVAFQERVRETLFRIEEKEEKPVKKKLTLSMALAFALCLCIVTVSALAASGKLTETLPDNTQQPLSHSENTPPPENAAAWLEETVWLEETEAPVYHLSDECTEIQTASVLTGVSLADAVLLGGTPCPACCVSLCYEDMDDTTLYHLFSGCPLMKTFTDSKVCDMVTSGRKLCGGCAVLLMTNQGEVQFLGSWPELTAPLATESPDMLLPTPEPGFSGETAVPELTEEMGFSPSAPTSTPIPQATEEPVLVWSNEEEEYYHAWQDCSETNVPQRTILAVAINRNQQPCPLCVIESTPMPTVTPQATGPVSTPAPAPSFMPTEQSNIAPSATPLPWTETQYYADLCQEYVYAVPYDLSGIYHQSPMCPKLEGEENFDMIPLQTALSSGKTACPDCTFCFPDPNTPYLYHMYSGCAVAGDPDIRYATRSIPHDKIACEECTVYVAGANSVYYHALPSCSDTFLAAPHSRHYAYLMGLTPCPTCYPGAQANIEPASAEPFGRQAEWTGIALPSFDSGDVITIHSASALRTAGGLYVEFMFSLKDETILPDSVRIALTDKSETELAVLSATLIETPDSDGKAVYLLCETLSSPEASFALGGLNVYGGPDADAQNLLAVLK